MIGTFWPLVDVYFSHDGNASEIIRVCRAMGLNVWWLLGYLFSYYSTSFVATLVGVDMMATLVVDVRDKDGMYVRTEHTPKDRTYDGFASLSALYTMKAPLMAIQKVGDNRINVEV